MKMLNTRIARLEESRAPAENMPEILFLEAARDGGSTTESALLVNCAVASIHRRDGETEADFRTRARRTLAANRREQA